MHENDPDLESKALRSHEHSPSQGGDGLQNGDAGGGAASSRGKLLAALAMLDAGDAEGARLALATMLAIPTSTNHRTR
jgi:hypothetical protein